MEGSRQQAVPAEAVPEEGQEREHKWAAKYGGRGGIAKGIQLHQNGTHVFAQGHVARTRCASAHLDVLIAGTNAWFRIKTSFIHLDLAKWAIMNSKPLRVQGQEENPGGDCVIVDSFHTL
jgi:hypothetical protein